MQESQKKESIRKIEDNKNSKESVNSHEALGRTFYKGRKSVGTQF